MIKTSVLLALLAGWVAASAQSLEGVVVDSSGGRIAGAQVELRTANGSQISSTTTDDTGRFSWPSQASGNYQLRIEAAGFAVRQLAVSVGSSQLTREIMLEPQSLTTQVTVTANRGLVEDAPASPYVAITADRAQMIVRPLPTIGNVLEQKPGVMVQQSTYAQVSPFLRGLTGYHVLNLIDGIRFTNSTFRSGPNQYLAFVEPSQADRIELLLGPTGAQYGSDSLGGTLNVITPSPRLSSGGRLEKHGEILITGASADASAGAVASVSLSGERLSALFGASGRRHADLRAGSGDDSRNVYRRLFGLSSSQIEDFIGDRQQDSGFSQYGLHAKLLARLPSNQILSLWAQHSGQDNVHGYKDLLGGLGRLQSAFDPQRLTFLYARYEKLRAGPFDSVNGAFSFNSQTDGSIRQGLNVTDSITRDWNRVDVYGWSAQAARQWTNRVATVFGGEIYDEHIRSTRFMETPDRRTATSVRALYPDRSAHQTYGIFGQVALSLTHRIRASGGLRGTGVRFRTTEQQAFGIPKSSQWFRDLTFSSSASWQVSDFFGVQGLVSRGFRAPNLNDLGAIGLNDLGYEIPAAEAIPAGALLSTDAGDGALSKQMTLDRLRPESLMNYEFGVRFTTRRVYARVQAFNAELYDPIVRRTLLFPVASLPAQLAGLAVSMIPQTPAQREQGVAALSVPFDSRSVKAFVNDGRARYYGIESLVEYKLSDRHNLEANYSFIAGRELNPNRNIRRLPPQSASATLRSFFGRRRMWVDLSAAVSGAQERLSGGDIDDERIGASRRRRDIADFFRGGRVQPFVDPASGQFRPTGETLQQIQNRVLPFVTSDDTRVPLYVKTAGWAAFHIRSGVPIGERSQLLLAIENLLDKNYRVHGSGIDAPGMNAYAAFRYVF